MASNLKDVQALILWARKNGIAWSSITCGTIHIDGADMKPADERRKPVEQQPQGMYAKYGAALLSGEMTARADQVQSSVIVEEEYE